MVCIVIASWYSKNINKKKKREIDRTDNHPLDTLYKVYGIMIMTVKI